MKKRRALKEEFYELDKLYDNLKYEMINQLNKILEDMIVNRTNEGDE